MATRWKSISVSIIFILSILLAPMFLSSCQYIRIKSSIKKFDNNDIGKRNEAVEYLAAIGKPAVNPLLEAMKNENPKIQSGAAETLGKIKDSSVIQPLTDLLNDKSEEFDVRCSAAAALGEMKNEASISSIINFIGEKPAQSPTLAFNALLNIGSASNEPLVNLWMSSSNQVKLSAKETLLKLSDIDIQPFLEMIKDSSEPKNNRISVMELVYEKKSPLLFDTLSSVLSDSDPDIRIASVDIISKLKDSRTFDVFPPLLKDTDKAVKLKVIEVLDNLKDTRTVDALLPLLKDTDKEVKIKVIEILSTSKDPKALDPLIETLKDTDLGVKKFTIEKLMNFNDNKAADALCTMVRDKNEEIWKYAVSLLIDAGAPFRDKFISSLSGDNLAHLYKNHDYFINLGIEGSDAALIRALNKYNSSDLAVDFLNCGNKKLDDAARDWAPKHGYKVINTSGGSAGPVWGSQN